MSKATTAYNTVAPKRILLLHFTDHAVSLKPIIDGHSVKLDSVTGEDVQAMLADLDRARSALCQHVHDHQ